MPRVLASLVIVVLAAVLAGCAGNSGSGGAGPERSPSQAAGFTVGMNAGGSPQYEARVGAQLRPAVVRVDFQIGTPVSQIAPTVAAEAARGTRVQLLATFVGWMPSSEKARQLATWAHAFGPGGTFWRGRSDGRLAVRYIEFGNETNQSYQYDGCGPGCPDYAQRAHDYALRVKDAQEAIDSPQGNSRVGLLAIADDSGDPTWNDAMYQAVPDLTRRVAGWTSHPYGPDYKARIRTLIDGLTPHGGGKVPIFVTEFGISTDNGRCLTDNYGWPKCLTYQQAGTSLRRSIDDMRATFGRQLAEVLIFAQVDGKPSGSTNDREAYFGAVQSGGQPKGPLTGDVRSLLATYRG